ncbi:PASTA domain-containing protein [Solirubrobacter sp. CPCC 204708]|uniref:PASTA domain-containing protein n=1 Tax=Solirubrobacter deserti TaxID=2282478 RepID=A0ABT4RDQ9_9ACTN|nr:PASTA domain-containing protein [Solirubrobacter deserti]MBE2317758.1 PASTA domain-containing protein [Solirubrobacter deserti]MDA0136465.1 PASTA domain-containing protein [Solirubrobacter deserti]
MFREGTTGRHRHAIGVALRTPWGRYDSEPPAVIVEPATEARLVVRVDNRSASDEHLELTVEGMPVGWAEVFPRTVEVPAGEQREADVSVHVPRIAEIKAAEWPLRVVAFARGRRVGSAPARVRVAPHAVVSLRLLPDTLRGRRRAFADVRVRNDGDAAAEVDLTAAIGAAAGEPASPDAAGASAGPLGCSISPPRVHVGPGEEIAAELEVRGPRRWLKRGEPVPVRVATHGASAEATFHQRASLAGWALLVPMVAAAIAGYLVARPNEVAVPKVTGLPVSEARERLREAGLKPRQAPLPAESASPVTGVVRQDPPAGAEIDDGGDVTISYYRGEGAGTVTPKATLSSVAPADAAQEPVAYAYANRVLVLFPGEAETPVGGTVGELSGDPAWDPRTGHLAYVRRASAEADAEVVVVDPRAPGTPRPLTAGGGSYVSPAFAPDGGRFAVISEQEPGAGGALCVVVPPATAPRCHPDETFDYYRPAWSADGLYTLRRKTGTSGQDELVRVGADLVPVGRPLAQGDLRALAVARDGRIAVINAGRIEVHAPAGELLAAQSVAGNACDLAWSGNELIASRGACGSTEEIVQLDPADLDAKPVKLFDGAEPAVAG